MVAHLVWKETIVTNMVLDTLNGEVIETEAVGDTGSALSLLSSKTVPRCAPELLAEVEDYPVRIQGITGKEVLEALTLPCLVAGKAVVADSVEPALLGLDFLKVHQATWDWKTSVLPGRGQFASGKHLQAGPG